jgi:5-methylcytosine-specific restriction endonuclease McrA
MTNERAESWQGSKWIRKEKRLAIYLRDGLACCYCGDTIEDGAKLSLDHVKPHSKGGSNHESNLVTCCSRCNSSRGVRSVAAFARAVADYLNHDADAEKIRRHVFACTRRSLPLDEAKQLIERRGSYSAALNGGN